MEGTALINRKGDKRTLCWWKCYIDSCASYHILFSEEFLANDEGSDAKMTGRCNAGTTVSKMKGTYGDFKVWLSKKGITNLISIPMLEAIGYIVLTYTHVDWVVTTPEGNGITFKRDKRVCTGMPYINICDQKEGLVMVETVRGNMGGNTPEQIKGAQLARVAQGCVGHPPDGVHGVLKQMVSDNIPENMTIGLDNVADALAIYGPPLSRLKGAKTR